MKKFISAAILGLSFVSMAGFADAPACPVAGDCPAKDASSLTADACFNKGVGTPGFCNCFATDTVYNCLTYFDGGYPVLCGTVPAVGDAFVDADINALITKGQSTERAAGGIVNFCEGYVQSKAGGNITKGNCEYDNSAMLEKSGVLAGCAGNWGNRTK